MLSSSSSLEFIGSWQTSLTSMLSLGATMLFLCDASTNFAQVDVFT